MLDTSVIIDNERGHLDLRKRLTQLGEEQVFLSAVTASELLHGVHRAKSEEQRRARSEFVEWLLSEIPIAEFGLAEARIHARIWAELAEQGNKPGAHDLLIAATALAQDCRVVTSDAGDFKRVAGLCVEDWTPAAKSTDATPPVE